MSACGRQVKSSAEPLVFLPLPFCPASYSYHPVAEAAPAVFDLLQTKYYEMIPHDATCIGHPQLLSSLCWANDIIGYLDFQLLEVDRNGSIVFTRVVLLLKVWVYCRIVDLRVRKQGARL
jgi:hypothetical protein